MGAASMDLFLQALFDERSSSNSDCVTSAARDHGQAQLNNNKPQQQDLGNTRISGSPDVIIVVDNARHHSERWESLPRRVQYTLMTKADFLMAPVTPPRAKLKKARSCDSAPSPASSRWLSMDSSTSSGSGGLKSPEKMPAPAPPSCPQRQQSIDVTAQATLAAAAAAAAAANASTSTSSSDRTPVLRSASSSARITSEKSGILPESLIPDAPPNFRGGSSSGLMCKEDMPRMPERQASDPSYDFSLLPPPSIPDRSNNSKYKEQQPQIMVQGQSFASKRSSGGLLDDIDSDDEDDEIELAHPHLMMQQALQGF